MLQGQSEGSSATEEQWYEGQEVRLLRKQVEEARIEDYCARAHGHRRGVKLVQISKKLAKL